MLIYIPYSFYLTISTLVGNSLGQGRVLQAKVIFRLTFYVCILIVGTIIAVCQLYSREIVKLYDDDKKVQDVAMEGVKAFTVTSFPFEFLVNMLMGLISGVGIQEEAANPAIFCYIFISVPSAWLMTFKYGLGVPGLFYGCACGQFALCMFYSKVIIDIDWEQQALEIEKQNEDARASRKSALSIGFTDDQKKQP